LRDFCPRGWQWAVFSDGLEFELSGGIEGNADLRAFVLFDGAECVIKHPRTYPHSLTFTNRDDALREAVSLARLPSLWAPAGKTRTQDDAYALAQMCKRMIWDDFHRLSAGRAERDDMDAATIKLRRALAEAGFDPR
jgi:hypothetical protein